MRGWMKWPGQGSGDDWHKTRNCRAASRWHVSRVTWHIAVTSHFLPWIHYFPLDTDSVTIDMYLYSSLESRLSAPSHTNDINITIYLADSAISIITNGDHADKYWYPPISGTNESRPPPPAALQLVLEQSSIRRFVIPEKAPTWAFCLLKVPSSTFTFKTLNGHLINTVSSKNLC